MAKSVRKLDEERENRKKEKWEGLRRNPAYITDYNCLLELRRTHVDTPKQVEATWDTCEKYDISGVHNPSDSYNEEISRAMDNEGFVAFPLRYEEGNVTIPHPIQLSSFEGRVEYDEPLRYLIKEEALYDSKYLITYINVNLPDKIIKRVVHHAVLCAREATKAKVKKREDKKGRVHLDKNMEAYKVWDLRRDKKSFVEIGKEVYQLSNIRRGAERARKSYLKAYKLIIGKQYKPFEKQVIQKHELEKICSTCEDKKCLKNLNDPSKWIPCPSVLEYIEQDQVKQQHSLAVENHITISN